MPKQVTDYNSGKREKRLEVGVRMPGDAVSQRLLSLLQRPLLVSSVHVDAALDQESAVRQALLAYLRVRVAVWVGCKMLTLRSPRSELQDAGAAVLDPAELLDVYGHRGADFVVSSGPMPLEGSTVLDLTGRVPKLLRLGKGPLDPFEGLLEEEVQAGVSREEEEEDTTNRARGKGAPDRFLLIRRNLHAYQ